MNHSQGAGRDTEARTQETLLRDQRWKGAGRGQGGSLGRRKLGFPRAPGQGIPGLMATNMRVLCVALLLVVWPGARHRLKKGQINRDFRRVSQAGDRARALVGKTGLAWWGRGPPVPHLAGWIPGSGRASRLGRPRPAQPRYTGGLINGLWGSWDESAVEKAARIGG